MRRIKDHEIGGLTTTNGETANAEPIPIGNMVIQSAITTVGRIQKLAQDIGVDRVLAVANKVTSEQDQKTIEAALAERGVPLLGVIPFDKGIHEAGLLGKAPLDHSPDNPAMQAVREILRELRSTLS